ncbi:hypothetical protein D3C75_792840 [compost metagenome]
MRGTKGQCLYGNGRGRDQQIDGITRDSMASQRVIQCGDGQFGLAGLIAGMEAMNNPRAFFYIADGFVQLPIQRRRFDAAGRQSRAGRDDFQRQDGVGQVINGHRCSVCLSLTRLA